MQRANIFNMKMKSSALVIIIIAIVLISCRGQGETAVFPVPNSGILQMDEPAFIGTANITGSQSGLVRNLPLWLRSFLDGGINAVESLEAYNNKYVFISVNEGENFNALTKWAEYFRTTQDFSILASARIERRFYLTTSLFPDDEYGEFFESIIKKANSAEYPGVVKDDTHWIRVRHESENGSEHSYNYMFFILTTVEKINMQVFIRNMMTRTSAEVTVNASQTTAINRLRQTFFEGF